MMQTTITTEWQCYRIRFSDGTSTTAVASSADHAKRLVYKREAGGRVIVDAVPA